VDQLIYLRVFSADICVSFFSADSRGKGAQIYSFFTPMIYQIIKKINSRKAAKPQSRKESPFAPLRLCANKKTLSLRRTGCKVGEAQRFCLRQVEQLIYLRVFSADICVSFFSVLDLR
jgi:hypothetical protein